MYRKGVRVRVRVSRATIIMIFSLLKDSLDDLDATLVPMIERDHKQNNVIK
jgi:hypothetical protein